MTPIPALNNAVTKWMCRLLNRGCLVGSLRGLVQALPQSPRAPPEVLSALLPTTQGLHRPVSQSTKLQPSSSFSITNCTLTFQRSQELWFKIWIQVVTLLGCVAQLWKWPAFSWWLYWIVGTPTWWPLLGLCYMAQEWSNLPSFPNPCSRDLQKCKSGRGYENWWGGK